MTKVCVKIYQEIDRGLSFVAVVQSVIKDVYMGLVDLNGKIQ
jgi:hypothetical protein